MEFGMTLSVLADTFRILDNPCPSSSTMWGRVSDLVRPSRRWLSSISEAFLGCFVILGLYYKPAPNDRHRSALVYGINPAASDAAVHVENVNVHCN